MIEWVSAFWEYDFMLRAFLAASLLSLVAGPLGCVVIWQRIVNFGDAMAHTALLGAALGVVLGVSLNFSVIFICIVMMLLLLILKSVGARSYQVSQNTLLAILGHVALALALILLALREDLQFDLYAFLFGDILAIARMDLYWIVSVVMILGLILIVIWRNLLLITLHPELAQVEGTPVARVRLMFLLSMALFVAVAMKLVGVILTVSLLIIPAAAARRLARTPESMAIIASLLAFLASAIGLMLSLQWDTPAGPAIVLVAALGFFVMQFLPVK